MICQVNGINLFYQKSGSGEPIILLHGNGEDHRIFDRLIKQLEPSHTVYAIDSRGHGDSSSSDILSYSLFTDDIASFIKELNIQKPTLYGFSDGGITGLLIAVRYPNLLGKLIISGTNSNPSGVNQHFITFAKIVYRLTGSQKYRIMAYEPQIKDEELSAINIPVLITAGENDLIRREHTEHLASLIPKHDLKIISGEDHGSYIIHSEKLYGIIKDFLFSS